MEPIIKRDYSHIDILNNLPNPTGLIALFGNQVKQHNGREWEIVREATPADLVDDSIVFVYGYINKGDWVTILTNYELNGRSLKRKRFKVVQIYKDGIEIDIEKINVYIPYNEIELSQPNIKRDVLKATKVADKKSGASFYEIKK